MRIDAHHHLWRYAPEQYRWIDPGSCIARDFGTVALHDAMAGCAIDGAIAVQARQSSEETRFLLDAAARLPAIMGVVAWIDLRADDIVQRLEDEGDARIVGYRHVVQDEADDDFLLDPRFVRGVRAVIDRALSYDLLVNARQLASVPAFLDRVGVDGARFVLDHAAKPAIARGEWQPWADRIAAVAQHPGVACKVSGLVTEATPDWVADDIARYLDHVFAVFGADRVIWGSDWPVCLLAADYRAVFDLVADHVERHCPAAAEAVFGGNAWRCYALDRQVPQVIGEAAE